MFQPFMGHSEFNVPISLGHSKAMLSSMFQTPGTDIQLLIPKPEGKKPCSMSQVILDIQAVQTYVSDILDTEAFRLLTF